MHDELQWTDVALHATRILNATERVVFVTPTELQEAPHLLNYARGDGYRPVIIPDSVQSRLPTVIDLSGRPIRDLGQYRREWNESFEFEFVSPDALSPSDRAVWARTRDILELAGSSPAEIHEVRISETMRMESYSHHEAVGLWDPGRGWIVIKRSQLSSLAAYAGTLLHEVAHARSGASDISAAFEHALTQQLGEIAARHLQGVAASGDPANKFQKMPVDAEKQPVPDAHASESDNPPG